MMILKWDTLPYGDQVNRATELIISFHSMKSLAEYTVSLEERLNKVIKQKTQTNDVSLDKSQRVK
jgi:hypothetical protein